MNYRLFIISVTLALGALNAYARDIDGYVRDELSGNTISAARINVSGTDDFCYTNNYGYFSLSVRGVDAKLEVYAQGFEIETLIIDSASPDHIEILLARTDYLIPENITNENRVPQTLTNPVSGHIKLSMDVQDDLVVLASEKDPIKSLQLLPGVEFGREGMGELFVRGGGARQNLYSLNGLPVYGDNHAFGFLSIYNQNELSSIELYRGAYPARFGGRLSSVVDMSSSFGNKEQTEGYAYASPMTIGFGINGPIGNSDKTSFSISARRSYLDILFLPYFTETGVVANFFDVQLNWETKLSDKSVLQFYSLYSRDRYVLPLELSDSTSTENWDFGWHYSTAVLGTKLNHIFSKDLFGSFSTGFSFYSPVNDLDITTSNTSVDEASEYDISFYTGNFDVVAKADFEWRKTPVNTVRYGANITTHGFNTGRYEEESRNPLGIVLNDVKLGDQRPSLGIESAAYVENEFEMTPNLIINAGARVVLYNYNGFLSPHVEPRIMLAYIWNKTATMKFSYMRVNQFLHSLNNDGVSVFMNRWVPSSDENKPGQSDQFNVSWVKHISGSSEFHMEGYYKNLSNLYLERDASSVARWVDYSSSLYKGAGSSYGVEFYLQKMMGSFTGYGSYAYSKANRQFDELNGEDQFPFNFDRRHAFKLGGRLVVDEEYTITMNLVIGSGLPYTLPNSIYRDIDGEIILGYDQINNYRASWYRRLDFGVIRNNFNWAQGGQRVTISLYNVFATKNTTNVFFEQNRDTSDLLYEAYKNVFFVFIPGFHYEMFF